MQDIIIQARRNCVLCSGRRLLRQSNAEKDAVQNALEKLYSEYTAGYNRLRKIDAPLEEIQDMRHNKTLALDLLHECRSCNKEVDTVNRSLKLLNQN